MDTLYLFEVQFSNDPLRQYHCQWIKFHRDREAFKHADGMIAADPDICFMRVKTEGKHRRLLREGIVNQDN